MSCYNLPSLSHDTSSFNASAHLSVPLTPLMKLPRAHKELTSELIRISLTSCQANVNNFTLPKPIGCYYCDTS